MLESIIKRLRKELGLTQSQFADALNITAATVSRIESGKAPLTDRMLHSISMEWNVSEDWLRTGNGEMFPVHPEDDALIEAFALIGAEDLDPRRKRLAKEIIDMILSMPDDSLSALQSFFQNAANALASSASANEDKEKDED